MSTPSLMKTGGIYHRKPGSSGMCPEKKQGFEVRAPSGTGPQALLRHECRQAPHEMPMELSICFQLLFDVLVPGKKTSLAVPSPFSSGTLLLKQAKL